MDGYQVKLIDIADELATTVETSQGVTTPNPMMGMEPFMRTPQQVQDLIDRTEGNLRELDR